MRSVSSVSAACSAFVRGLTFREPRSQRLLGLSEYHGFCVGDLVQTRLRCSGRGTPRRGSASFIRDEKRNGRAGMMFRFALRSLALRPVKTIVLAFGFGLGVAIMAILLGIGEVILEQAHSPALQGGGDVAVAGAFGSIDNARFVLSSVLGAGNMRPRVAAMSPAKRSSLYLIAPDKVWAISARGGVPSMEAAVGDAETGGRADWIDATSDQAWTAPDPGDVLREMDRFHRQPPVAEFASSWAEWLYFNGRGDGRGRTSQFYLTFPGRTFDAPRQTERRRAAATRTRRRAIQLFIHRRSRRGDRPRGRSGYRRRRQSRTPRRPSISDCARPDGGRQSHVAADRQPDARRGPRAIASANRHARRPRVAFRVCGAGLVRDHPWRARHRWPQAVARQPERISRSQLGLLARRALAMGTGGARRSVVRLRPRLSAVERRRSRADSGLSGHPGTGRPDRRVHGCFDRGTRRRRPSTGSGDYRPQSWYFWYFSHPAPGIPGIPGINIRLVLSVDRAVRSDFTWTTTADTPRDFLQLAGVYRVTGQTGDRRIDFTARGAAETFRAR